MSVAIRTTMAYVVERKKSIEKLYARIIVGRINKSVTKVDVQKHAQVGEFRVMEYV